MNQQELLELLKRYEQAYYSGESLVSDEEYDAIKDSYVEQYGEYDFVPNEGETGFTRIKHKYPLKSLSKKQLEDKEGIKKLLTKLWPVIIEPKIDGLSIEITDEKLCITRGDGEYGDDVTEQCSQINGLENIKPFNCSIRGEVLMKHSQLERLNAIRIAEGLEPYSNCRNTAAGMLRNLDMSKIEGLSLIIYEILGSKQSEAQDLNDLHEQLSDLIDGTEVMIVPYYEPTDVDDAIRYLNTLEEFRESIDYDIDGWVVKSNLPNSLEKFGGYTNHHPKNAFAVKGEAKGKWTQILDVVWQTAQDNITPVALLSPVEIEGSVISRCTLHNWSQIKALGLTAIKLDSYHKTEVFVIKANDVIPRIINVRHTCAPGHDPNDCYVNIVVPPNRCPVCGADTAFKETESDSEILRCTSDLCDAKLKAKLETIASRKCFDIMGLSEGTISKIVDSYVLQYPSDIFCITKEQILALEGYAEKSASSLYSAIKQAQKEQPLDKVLYASCIPLIGLDASKRITKVYTIEELSNILDKSDDDAIKDLCKIKGIGIETAKSLVQNKEQFRLMFVAIEKVTDIAVKDNGSSKKQLTFAITGQREPFKTIIESEGHKIAGTISSKTVALIDVSGNSKSSKAIKAKKLGIPVISTIAQLRELI